MTPTVNAAVYGFLGGRRILSFGLSLLFETHPYTSVEC